MKTVLTGIKPTGTAHIGNYFGAIKPAIEMTKNDDCNGLFFIADYHALNTIKDSSELTNNIYQIAATWLACGLNKDNVVFYRQSDVPETFELASVLNNVTPKGLMNRAHAYKAMVEQNEKENKDTDFGVNMGLFNYPILMAADILLMDTNLIPVGQDQKQHCEITKEICRYFNHTYKDDILVMPEEHITKGVEIVPGLDGRKMSKSYNNTIPLFCSEKELEKLVKRIVTDSSLPNEPKSTDSLVFKYYSLFANETQLQTMKERFNTGIGWGEAKKELFNVMNEYLTPLREKYNYYITHPEEIDKILDAGSVVARKVAQNTIKRVRKAIINR